MATVASNGNNENIIATSFVSGVITFVNFRSVKLFVKIQNIFSSCKIIVCTIIIAGGIYNLTLGKYSAFNFNHSTPHIF